jgi:hypothetical protein
MLAEKKPIWICAVNQDIKENKILPHFLACYYILHFICRENKKYFRYLICILNVGLYISKISRWSGVLNVRSKVFKPLFMKSYIFWDITACSLLKFKFDKLCLLPVSGKFLLWFIFRPWRWRQYFLPKSRVSFNVMSQKIEIFGCCIFRVFTHVPTMKAEP